MLDTLLCHVSTPQVVITAPSHSFICLSPSQFAVVPVNWSQHKKIAKGVFFFHVPSYEKRLYWGKRKRKQSIRRTQHPDPCSPEQMHRQHVITSQTGSLGEIKQKPWTWLRKFREEPTHSVMSSHKSFLYFLLWPGLWSQLLITIKSLCLF